MENEKILIIQFRFTRKSALLMFTALFLVYNTAFLGSEQLTLTTYYPAPYGGYVSLLTTGQTLLARDTIAVTPKSKVGVGVTGEPATKLEVSDTTSDGARIRLSGGNTSGLEFGGVNTRISQNSTDIVVYTNNLERTRVSNLGTFSVGTTANGGNVSIPYGNINFGSATLAATGFINRLCALRSFTFPGPTNCPAGMRVIAVYGNSTVCPTGRGSLLRNVNVDMHLTSNWTPEMTNNCAGTMLCCKIGAGL